MALPKRRHSRTRRDIRRGGHPKMKPESLVRCKATNVLHRRGRAYVYQNDLYYKGKVVIRGFLKTR